MHSQSCKKIESPIIEAWAVNGYEDEGLQKMGWHFVGVGSLENDNSQSPLSSPPTSVDTPYTPTPMRAIAQGSHSDTYIDSDTNG